MTERSGASMKASPDLRVAAFRLAKKRRKAAEETVDVTGKPSARAQARVLAFPGKDKLRVGAPTFSGTIPVAVGSGFFWSIPKGSRTLKPTNGGERGVYVLNGVTNDVHFLRINEFNAVEEVQLPATARAELLKLFGRVN